MQYSGLHLAYKLYLLFFGASKLIMSRPTVATIDLGALKHNLSVLVNMAGSSKVVSVVKADAYGNGALEVARVLEPMSDALAVAFLHEAIVLRDAGIKKAIIVLQGAHEEEDFLTGLNHNIIWMMHCPWQLKAYSKFVLEHACTPKAWFKFDSGMHRLGFPIQDFESVIASYPNLINQHSVVVTHLASADATDKTHATAQIEHFLEQVQSSNMALSIANSATHIRFCEARKQYVRLGIALYGAIAIQAQDKPIELKPVMHLNSQIMALRTVPKGELVGYGGTWCAPRESIIATVALGYADGYPRHAPTGTPAWCNDEIIALVGRVSMDMLTFDVTNLANVSIGDTVQLWGDKLPINQVAEHIGTISYELMTRVSQRVPRRYINE